MYLIIKDVGVYFIFKDWLMLREEIYLLMNLEVI